MLGYLGGFFLGSGLGANDAANVFGTAVGSRMVRFRTAAILAAIFVLLGAALQGARGIETLSSLTPQSPGSATIAVFAAALTVALMTLLRLPTSTSQAVVGAIVGIGLLKHDVNVAGLPKIAICWMTTPFGALLCYVLLDQVGRFLVRRLRPSVFALDPILRWGLVLCGCYGAYALGANNVANVATVFVCIAPDTFTPARAAALGGLSIAVGVLFFSRPVMMTVGKGIVRMDAFAALIAVLAQAVTVHMYALLGVPVSSSQAIVGAVLGISLVKGLQVLRLETFRNVLLGWLVTPGAAALAAIFLRLLAGLRYTPVPM